ncbi:MAG: hypothetical protein K2I06_03815 [Ruminococcus sp.]|nr:hypothetical protein [Ruminococcus sp.]
MKRLRQFIYTVLLLLTCLVASPIIFKQIWESSKAAEPASSKKPPVIDIHNKNSDEEATSDLAENPFGSEFTTIPATEEVTTEPPPPEPVFVESDPSYFDDALFIGDSRTVGLNEYGTLKNADYFCSVGLASYKIDSEYINGYSIYDMLSSRQYGKIYVMLGINECGNDFNYTVDSFSSMMDTIREYQPDAIIYIMSSLHVTAIRQAQGDTITNENINRLNEAQSKFADGQTIFYIDVNEIFDDSEGNLMAECSNDGVHVLAKYYQTWCEWLCLNTVPVENSDENEITTDMTTTEYEDPYAPFDALFDPDNTTDNVINEPTDNIYSYDEYGLYY